MLIRYENAHKKSNGQTCTVWEYNFVGHPQVGFSCAYIHGRYPEKGSVVNTACDLMYYIVAGQCHLYVDDVEYELHEHDAFFIEKNKNYYVVGQGAVCALVEHPRWTPEQCKMIGIDHSGAR
jgi:hypothetical protein